MPLAMLAASSSVNAQQYFNGTQTTPNNAINGGSGPWDTVTTNWTNATGTATTTYNSAAPSVTVFGSSGASTPATGGTVTVTAGGIQLTGTVQFRASGDTSGYFIDGGTLTTASGGTAFDVSKFQPPGISEVDIASGIVGVTGITKTGEGGVFLSGTNTYTGNTIITSGFLGVTPFSSLSSTANSVTVNGATAILQLGGAEIQNGGVVLDGGGLITGISLSSSGTFDMRSGRVFTEFTGTGGVTKTTAGRVDFFEANTYTGNTLITAGELALHGPATLGNTANSVTVNGASAVLELGGTTQTQNGGVSLQNGTIQNGTLSSTGPFDLRSGVVSAVLTGTGGVTKTTAGTVTLSGTNSYSGGTTISGGTLQLGNGGTAGSVVGNVIDNATLAFNRSDAVVFDGLISGSGAVNQIGSGSTRLTASNTYSGGTTVDNGVLVVDGSIALSSLLVNSAGTLAGTGIVGNTSINGGVLSPGNNSIGTLTVQGNLTLATAATYMVQVSGNSVDRIAVTNNAMLAGTVAVQMLSRVATTTTYTILTSAGTSGTFQSVVLTNVGFARNPHLSYAGGNVFLTVDPGLLSPILPASANANQTRVAGAIDNALLGGSSLPAGFNSLFGLFGAGLTNALTQASGETATGSQQTTFNAMAQFMGVMTDPFIAGRDDGMAFGGNAAGYAEEDPLGYAGRRKPNDALAAIYTKAPLRDVYDPRWSVWAAGFGGSQTTDGNAALGSNNTTSRVFGVAAGADYIFSPRTIAGFALAGGGTNFSVVNGGTGRSDLFQAGAFVRHNVGAAYISAAAAYGWQDVTTDRTVTIAGIDQLRARFNANAYSGRVENGYRFVSPWMGSVGITPYAAGQFTTFDLPAYAEQVVSGANTFALGYAAKSVTETRSELGLRADKSYVMQDAVLTLRGRAAWAHDFNPDRAASATFQTLPGASFVVNGAQQASDSALTTASAEVKWMNGWSVAGTFEGEFSNVTRSYAGKGVVRYAW
jgi:autotransporter-associated beta strand protein